MCIHTYYACRCTCVHLAPRQRGAGKPARAYGADSAHHSIKTYNLYHDNFISIKNEIISDSQQTDITNNIITSQLCGALASGSLTQIQSTRPAV